MFSHNLVRLRFHTYTELKFLTWFKTKNDKLKAFKMWFESKWNHCSTWFSSIIETYKNLKVINIKVVWIVLWNSSIHGHEWKSWKYFNCASSTKTDSWEAMVGSSTFSLEKIGNTIPIILHGISKIFSFHIPSRNWTNEEISFRVTVIPLTILYY